MLATATASAQLVNAGFSASASLVIGGAVVGGSTTALTATMSAALKEIFRQENIATAAHGMPDDDLYAFQKSGTASGTTEVNVLTAASNYRQCTC